MNEIDETLPDVVKNFLRSGAKLESIALDARGKWTHVGLDFENKKIIDLFFRSVKRSAGGTWVLEIPPFTYPIEVERTGYFVERFNVVDGAPVLEISDATEERLDNLDGFSYEGNGEMYVRIKDGQFEARLKKPAYYAAAEWVEETNEGLVMVIGELSTLLTKNTDD